MPWKWGITAPEIVEHLIALHPEIELVNFESHGAWSPVSEELKTRGEASLERIALHTSDHKIPFVLGRAEVTRQKLLELADDFLKQGRSMALCSNVKIFGSNMPMHIPMLDFACPVNTANTELIKKYFALSGCEGVIIESGNSYHFYGFDLLRERELFSFLGRCLLFGGLADARYIGHKIIDGFANLRISKSMRHPSLPFLSAVVSKADQPPEES